MGAAIGVAMIIPGVSGGTLAVLLKIYDKLINAISDLRRDFKNSFYFLLPIVLGAVIALIPAYFCLKFFLEVAPLPTVLLFVGLMVGSFPKMFKDTLKLGFKKTDIACFVLPLLLVVGICFIPNMGDVNLGGDMPVIGYFVLIAMGALASCALVVPGISGSMLMLIFGYYQPILNTISAISTDFWHSALVLALFGLGIIVGFFSIAKLMKFLLNKFSRGTNWAIIGFVVGSIPAIFITFPANFPDTVYDAVNISVGVILCFAGAIASFALTAYVESRKNKEVKNDEN